MSWLRGVVKEVPSGDTVVVAAGAKPGQVPAEKRITLSSLVAPKLVRRESRVVVKEGQAVPPLLFCAPPRSPRPAPARPARAGITPSRAPPLTVRPFPKPPPTKKRQGRRDGSSKDEPFAWEAREFLRRKLIGKVRAAPDPPGPR